jgi:hypothetical protein
MKEITGVHERREHREEAGFVRDLCKPVSVGSVLVSS